MPKVIMERHLEIKPLSANKMHYAKMKKDTKEYVAFKKAIADALRKDYGIDKDDKLKLTVLVGYSSKLSDLDNCLKPLLDSMQLAMYFDDRQVFEIHCMKAHVAKGDDFIMVRLETITKGQWKRRVRNLFPTFFPAKPKETKDAKAN